MTPSTAASRSDSLSWTTLAICALATIALHLLLVVPFCKQKAETEKVDNTDRVNILFPADDPAFANLAKQINSEPDPAEFIRGNDRTGYSFRRYFDTNPSPVLFPPVQLESPVTLSEQPDTPDLTRSYSDLCGFRALHLPGNDTADSERVAKDVSYPLWVDAFGAIEGIRDDYREHYMIYFSSKDVVSPTLLEIHYPVQIKKIPPYVVVLRSCGNIFLDSHAKRLLQTHLTSRDFLSKFDPAKNCIVSVYWRPGLMAVNPEQLPEKLLPEGETLP